MRKTIFLISLFILLFNLKANANRSIYIDNFETILGDITAENTLLNYAQSNDIKTLLLYGLHIVNANHNLSNPASNQILADFIDKAKTTYGVLYVGATAENEEFFTNIINTYNNSRNNSSEKFDIYNLEFEYWINSATGPSGYYCTTYLTPNGLPCTTDGAFQFYISTLQTMSTLASNNSHPITTEAYVGWPTALEASTIGTNLDRVRIHAYVSDPNTAFNYSEDRLIDFANGNPDINVSIIFSSEPIFMQNWLISNSMTNAENIFTQDWIAESSNWSNNINLEGFTYFAYTHNTDVTLSSNSENIHEKTKIFPNPTQNTLYVLNINTVQNISVYNNLGQLILETKEEKINIEKLKPGVYFFKFQTKKRMESIKIIKK